MVTSPSVRTSGALRQASPAQQVQSNHMEQKPSRQSEAPGATAAQGPAANAPFSARRSAPLDLSTVERREHGLKEPVKRSRPYGLTEAPTFHPTEEEWKDAMGYIRKISPEGKKYGICKIVPPEGWNPPFAPDTERFHFRTRKQELNSVEGSTRANLNYLDQLTKFHKQNGANLSRFPSVDKRPLDLYKLKKAVDTRGGFDQVCKLKKWAEIGRDLGYSGKIMSSLSTSLKNSFQRWLHPYEEYLRIAKPGVHQQMEMENGSPYTPTPKQSPATSKPQSAKSRASARMGSPATRAAAEDHRGSYSSSPAPSAPRNLGGFTPVNSGFVAVNNTTKRENEHNISNGTPDNRNGNSSKRSVSHDCGEGKAHADSGDDGSSGRRSKRLKRDSTAPNVSGSHMNPLRPSSQTRAKHTGLRRTGDRCEACGKTENRQSILSCDSCDSGYHIACLDPPLEFVPDYDWHCPKCLVGTGEYGFEDGGIYSLKQFQEKANAFKANYFAQKMPFDPVLNTQRKETEDDVEREFWRLVESLTETVEVEYGADVHSTTHGSGFPTVERHPLDPYSSDPWNLTVLPLYGDSLFRHIKTDVSGMTVPWLYVGMCFSTFCWHNEDHYSYSANYQHFGATKTWYGIPGEDAEAFEEAMRQAVPELFETQPDLLFQLVTLLPPDQLKKAGVRVYALDQRAGQMVLTFPKAYHAGFNHGFNFNEAVNFAPIDWEPLGQAGVERLQEFRRQPCFSHDELLITAAARDTSIETAKWLGPGLRRMCDREIAQRRDIIRKHKDLHPHTCKMDGGDPHETNDCKLQFIVDNTEVPEEEYQCTYCKMYSYMTMFRCEKTRIVLCLPHAECVNCCGDTVSEKLNSPHHQLKCRLDDASLSELVEKVQQRATIPEAWSDKLDKLLLDEPRPSLKALHSLVSEGEKIPYFLPGLQDLYEYVSRCDQWIEEANVSITRKQQNRRKNEKTWRRSSGKGMAQMEERERETRSLEKIYSLLAEAEDLSFDCPQITSLKEKVDEIKQFQRDAQAALVNPLVSSVSDVEELVERGRGFNVDIPEIDTLEKALSQIRWNDSARQKREGWQQTLEECGNVIKEGEDLGIPPSNDHLLHFKELQRSGETWEAKAKELISVETVHYQQLEALSAQAARFPVSQETLAAVDAILIKQREAQKQISNLYQGSKDPDFRKRPLYKDVRDLMESLARQNSKPSGTIDLEREQKRHEDWMRKGKKLFGKANAPLHILKAHMQYVEKKNSYCFDLEDRCRPPVEPSSRPPSPDGITETPLFLSSQSRTKDVFCICRQQESGLMIECGHCHEWYHGKCLKIARAKVKDVEDYTCPICDWRVKIPRDAARPKLEDLLDWQAEIVELPFQPEEEQILDSIITKAVEFRKFLQPLTNPACMTAEEVPTQIFYLRKIEGSEILLAYETNFFRQEIHRWMPVAPEPPPILEHSLSTRKPRPTKQQKIMAQLGIDKPEDLPLHLRTRHHTFSNSNGNVSKHKSTDSRPSPLRISPNSHTPPGNPPALSNGLAHSASISGISMPPTSGDYGFSNPFSLATDPGPEPLRAGSAAFLPQVSTSVSAADTFDPISPTTAGHGLDTSLFALQAAARDGGMKDGAEGNPFGSSPRENMDDIFADLTNQDEPGDEGDGDNNGEPGPAEGGGDGDGEEPLAGMETSHADEALEMLRSAENSAVRPGETDGDEEGADGERGDGDGHGLNEFNI